MEKIYEILDSIQKRLSNPILFSFLISWLIINYKLIIVIFNDEHYIKKFDYIYTQLYTETSHPSIRLFWLPLLAVVIYVCVIPAISLLESYISGRYNNKSNEIRNKLLKKSVLTSEQADILRRESAALIEKYQRDAEDAKKFRIDSSKSMNTTIQKIFKTISPSILKQLPSETGSWANPIRMEPTKTLNGTPEQEEFALQYGIPEKWASLLYPNNLSGNITTRSAAKILELEDVAIYAILLKLTAIGILMPMWVDDQLEFTMQGGSWAALLNGRPA